MVNGDDDDDDDQYEDGSQSSVMKLEYIDDNRDGRCISHFFRVIQNSEEIGPNSAKKHLYTFSQFDRDWVFGTACTQA